MRFESTDIGGHVKFIAGLTTNPNLHTERGMRMGDKREYVASWKVACLFSAYP